MRDPGICETGPEAVAEFIDRFMAAENDIDCSIHLAADEADGPATLVVVKIPDMVLGLTAEEAMVLATSMAAAVARHDPELMTGFPDLIMGLREGAKRLGGRVVGHG